jgi:galactose mutarotase-like enzyme
MPTDGLVLASDALQVTIRPDKGADIVSIIDRRTDTELMWQAPWGAHPPGAHPFASNSLDHWIARNGGGWNILLPNAGPERSRNGAVLGFHGEAATISWEVLSADAERAHLRTSLLTAPLTIHRSVCIDGAELIVEETLTNESPDPTSFRWGHHPTFGGELIADGVRIEGRCAALSSDPSSFGVGRATESNPVNLDEALPLKTGGAFLLYASKVEGGSIRLVNDDLDLAVELDWPTDVFPWTWIWAELEASAGYPWFRRVRALAIEPHTSVPHLVEEPVLEGSSSTTAAIRLRVSAAQSS